MIKNHNKIVILTDSQSSCIAIQNSFKNTNRGYYKNKIINKASIYENKYIIIQWIPTVITELKETKRLTNWPEREQ